jgi:hypothetical protein
MANLDEDLDEPGAAPGGDEHFTSSPWRAGGIASGCLSSI